MPRGINRRTALLAAVAGIALGVATATPAQAVPAPRAATPAATAADPAAAQLAVAAGITPAQAAARLATQAKSVTLADTLTRQLGARSGGAYLERDGRLTVTVTDAAAAATVTKAGATAKVVTRSSAELTAVKTAFDKAGAPVGASWGIDTAANKVAVTLPTAAPAALTALAARYGDAVALTRADRTLSTQSDVMGGDPIYHSSGARCSAGFNVWNGATRYVLTAGHCNALGGTWNNWQNYYLGPSAGGVFPGNDFGVVRDDGGITQVNGVYLYNGYYQPITAAGSGYGGLYACKSGSTTGLTCGYVSTTNVTVNYPQGTVYGLDQTGICTQAGDSGGSYFTGSTALGVVSGGQTGTCVNFMQPVLPALSYFGLSLI